MDNGPYNPYANRDVETPLTNLDAFFSLLKCIVGTGILAMPKAFFYAGILGGVILTIVTTMVLMYGMHLLIKCMVESARQQEIPYCTYSESMTYAFSVGPSWCKRWSRWFGFMVNLVLALSHYGIAVVYILFVAKNVQQLIHYHFSFYGLEIFVAVVGMLLLPLFMVRQLKYLVPLNVLSNVLMYVGFLLIFYYLFRGLPPIADRRMFGAFEELLEFFGIALFAVTSVGVMLAIESKMATPEKYIGCFGILNIAATIVVFSNLLFGILGFWRYGDEIRGSVTLNLPTDTVF
ncbi:glutamate transporter polyphemus-like isoform X2 [Drosophila tropicalis]|uniref:glutamate transporter polyphemus-like isoform X2 n=1 Tax=Drosophila tropicalis TaxID=46794 RepID=UPI0035AC2511